MLNVSKINLSIEQIFGKNPSFLLVHSKQWKEYLNGKVTENVLGTQYELVFMGGEYDHFWVKVTDIGLGISEEDIRNESDPIYVELIEPVCKLYVDQNGQIQISVKASGISPVKK